MKKILFGVLFLTTLNAFANLPVNQNNVLGNWTLTQEPDPSSNINYVKDTLKLTRDWKVSQVSYYDISSPGFGPNKIDLKYKLKMTINGDYRLENGNTNLRRYVKNEDFISEIIEGSASDEEAARTSLRDVERQIREETRLPARVLSLTETEMVLQGVNGKPNLTYTKPRKLPVSRITKDTIPFEAPDGWRFPSEARELSDFPKRLDSRDISLLTYAKGDFNGDGFRDAAAYLINDETGQVALFLHTSKSDGSYDLVPYGNAERNTVIRNGVILAPPGEYTHATNKKKITTENPGFMTIIFDVSATLVYWDGTRWTTIPLGKRF
ncbi:MAG: hypothetical protein LBC64_04665 [Fibromonadaceae bacterium]|jgi:hypothetical protein|nr:hypothetical protein [Fibromonadaceae bacterium]